ncbi:MAG: DinB family protein [Aquificales bacterium]|nr:DinB family protein [Aquificales bacterium]
MLDFTPIQNKEKTYAEFAADFSPEDLHQLTNEMIDMMLAQIADCVDADVVFEPFDPDADDPYAVDDAEQAIAWTLGHVIVHVTASAEESAFIAAEMARGVEPHGRSRSEIPWQTVTTIQQCRDRLEEARRMRLATLAVWPDEPHLDVVYEPWPGVGQINAIGQFILGFGHETSHFGHIDEIVRQAKAARGT